MSSGDTLHRSLEPLLPIIRVHCAQQSGELVEAIGFFTFYAAN